MASSRTLLAVVGVAMALGGVVVAGYVDKIAGIAMVFIGGFLLSIVVTRSQD